MTANASNWTCTAWSCALPTAGWWNRGRWRGSRIRSSAAARSCRALWWRLPTARGGERLVLIDGYRRVAALRRLGRDTASVEQWACDLTDALLGLLARTQNRPFASIEEALLIRELMQGLGLSQHDLARRCGRDVSWVSRRLQLLSGLPDAALTAVRDGRLSSWAASRMVVPLARANTEHADQLLDGAGRCAAVDARIALLVRALPEGLSLRSRPYGQPSASVYRRAARGRSSSAPANVCATDPKANAPADLRSIEAILARLRKRVAALRPLPRTLIDAAPRLRATVEALISEIQREGAHDPDRDP